MSGMIECKDIQSDKFKDAAREAECDEDEARWTERLKKVAKAAPAPDASAPKSPMR